MLLYVVLQEQLQHILIDIMMGSELIRLVVAQVIIYVLFYLFDKKHREMYPRLFIITLLY